MADQAHGVEVEGLEQLAERFDMQLQLLWQRGIGSSVAEHVHRVDRMGWREVRDLCIPVVVIAARVVDEDERGT